MSNAETYIISGNNKMLIADYLGAIFDFTKAIMVNPVLPHPYTSRAAAKLELHDYEGAIQDCTEAIKLHYKAEIKVEEKFDNNSVLRPNPIYAKLYSMIGTAKLILGKTDEALIELNTARLLGNKDVIDLIKVYGK